MCISLFLRNTDLKYDFLYQISGECNQCFLGFKYMVLFMKKNYQKEKQTKTTEPPFSKIRNTKRYFHHDKNISMGVNYRLLFSL